MIVQYVWITTRKARHRGGYTVDLDTRWKGWFLFGLIPLFVMIVNREYPR